MLSKKMVKRLNEQVKLEMYSSNLYLAMSAWCASKGLNGSAAFMMDHSKEELAHAYKLFNYINETGAVAVVDAIDKPKSDFKDLKDVFEQTYKHEISISKSISELVDTALDEKDYATFNFLQWYISEQHEEEKLFKDILDKIDIIGMDGRGLFMIDREIASMIGSH